MLEITPDDVALLNDTDLRTLIGLLCESEPVSYTHLDVYKRQVVPVV